jgi:hypothetical protein
MLLMLLPTSTTFRILYGSRLNLREDPSTSDLFLRFYLDYDAEAAEVICDDYFNNDLWDPATSDATYCTYWHPDQLRELVLLLIQKMEEVTYKENSKTTN